MTGPFGHPRPGWQISNYRDPYPKGTEAVVLVDAYATGNPEGFYVVPIAHISKIILELFDKTFPDGVRPVSPSSLHAVVTPSVEQYRDAWDLHLAS